MSEDDIHMVSFDEVLPFIRAAANIMETDHIGDRWLTPIASAAREYLEKQKLNRMPSPPTPLRGKMVRQAHNIQIR